ncbi:hypothetical protein ACFX13_034382 [Malus domestica]
MVVPPQPSAQDTKTSHPVPPLLYSGPIVRGAPVGSLAQHPRNMGIRTEELQTQGRICEQGSADVGAYPTEAHPLHNIAIPLAMGWVRHQVE